MQEAVDEQGFSTTPARQNFYNKQTDFRANLKMVVVTT